MRGALGVFAAVFILLAIVCLWATSSRELRIPLLGARHAAARALSSTAADRRELAVVPPKKKFHGVRHGSQFEVCETIGHHGIEFDVRLAQALGYLMDHLRFKTALDFEPGYGLYSAYLAKHVANITDMVNVFNDLPRDTINVQELKTFNTRSQVMLPRRVVFNLLREMADNDEYIGTLANFNVLYTYQLVYSIDVFEHLVPGMHARAIDFLTSKVSKILVFSAGHKGQAGREHLTASERAPNEYKNLFQKKNLTFLPRYTQAFTKAASPPNHHVNTMVFSKDPDFVDEPPETILRLARLANWSPRTERHAFDRQNWPKLAEYIDGVTQGKPCSSDVLLGRTKKGSHF